MADRATLPKAVRVLAHEADLLVGPSVSIMNLAGLSLISEHLLVLRPPD